MDSIVKGLENLVVTEAKEDKRESEKEKLSRKERRNQRMINCNTQERSYVYRKFASLCIELK